MRQSKYSEEEKAAYRAKLDKLVEEMKEKLKADGVEVDFERHDDYILQSFLRARALDVDKAYELFVQSLKWREEMGVDNFLETAPKENRNFPLIQKYWPGHFHKVDKDGAPVYYEKIGSVDVRGLINSIPGDDLINYHLWQQETHRIKKQQLSKEKGKSMYAHIVVEDLSGLSMSHIYTPAIDVFKRVIAIDQENYPDTLKAYYVINAPTIMPMAFNMLKPFLDARTKSKIHILGSDYSKALLEAIDAENLPAEYGGACNCEGGCVPGGGEFVDRKDDGTSYNPVQATVGRKDKYEVKLPVDKSHKVAYEFSCEGYDIGFGVFFQHAEKDQRTPIVEVKRFNAHEEVVRGHVVAPDKGTMVMHWDNTYSMLWSKTITYQLALHPPEDEQGTST